MRQLSMALGALALVVTPACGATDDGEDTDTHMHMHEAGESGDTGDENTSLSFDTAPPAAATAGEGFDVTYTVSTEGELHVSEIRACMGAVADCGATDDTSYDEKFAAVETDGTYSATVTLPTAGEWTIVAFAHVGPDPHTSDTVSVTVT